MIDKTEHMKFGVCGIVSNHYHCIPWPPKCRFSH